MSRPEHETTEEVEALLGRNGACYNYGDKPAEFYRLMQAIRESQASSNGGQESEKPLNKSS